MDVNKRRDAARVLVNIGALEALTLAVVVGVYLYTNNLTYLVGGIVGAQLIFAPLFIRWARERGPALKADPDKRTE